jgi:hypothetical protein
MAHKALIVAFSMMVASSPVSATQPEPDPMAGAPAAGPDARYCLRIEITGSRLDKVRCWTREKWAEQEVDVDKEWAREGVRIIA